MPPFAKQRGRMTGLGWSRSRSKSSIKRYETRVKLTCYEEGICVPFFSTAFQYKENNSKEAAPFLAKPLDFVLILATEACRTSLPSSYSLPLKLTSGTELVCSAYAVIHRQVEK